jgi:bifunctional non-homologous end joining protein LigD
VTEVYVVVEDRAGLVSLAQIAAVVIHAWGSRADRLDQPDQLIFDIDPGPNGPRSKRKSLRFTGLVQWAILDSNQ